MSIFKKKKKIEVVDERTELEKSFEDKGQEIGLETGKFVQKGVDKVNELKEKYNTDEKMVKVKEKIDEIVDKTKVKVEQVKEQVKDKVKK